MQLPNVSLVRSLDLVKDELGRINNLSCHVDFLVINMKVDSSSSDLSVLLGNPFLKKH